MDSRHQYSAEDGGHDVDGDAMSAGPADEELAKSSALVAAGIFLSRLSGLVREAATGAFLGTGPGADAFRAALRIPNLLQNLLGEGVLSAAFIPVYSQALAERREQDAGRLAATVAAFLLVTTTVIVVLAVAFADPITRVLTPGFEPGSVRFDLTVTLVRIVTPGVGFLVFSAWCLGILNSHRRFFLAYVAPVVWNAAIVTAVSAAALAGFAEAGVARSLAWGALCGSVLQFAVQLPMVRRLAGPMRPSLRFDAPGFRTVFRRFGEVVAGRGSVQLAGYLDLILASFLAAGAFSAVGYAQVLYLLPISLFGMSVAAAELPALATMDHSDHHRVTERLNLGLGRVAYFVLPSMAAFLVAGDLVVATVYQGVRFTADDSAQVGAVLSVYALGLLAATSTRLLQSSLYGAGDTRAPAAIALIRVLGGIALAAVLIFPLDAFRITTAGIERVGELAWSPAPLAERTAEEGLHRLGAVGLAAGSVFGAWLEYALLRRRVTSTFGAPRIGGAHRSTLLIAVVIAALVGLAARTLLRLAPLHPKIDGILVATVIGAMYVAVTHRAGIPESREIIGRVRRLGRR